MSESTTRYQLEHAKSGRSKCRGKCKETIEKDALRFGSSSDSGGFETTYWRCFPKCMTAVVANRAIDAHGSIENFLRTTAIPPAEYASVTAALNGIINGSAEKAPEAKSAASPAAKKATKATPAKKSEEAKEKKKKTPAAKTPKDAAEAKPAKKKSPKAASAAKEASPAKAEEAKPKPKKRAKPSEAAAEGDEPKAKPKGRKKAKKDDEE